MKKINLSGRTFSYLSVIAPHKDNKWQCKCVCGKVVFLSANRLLSGNTKSCGCKKSELCRVVNIKHGMADKTRLYGVWKSMRQRCQNPKAEKYPYYGGRGINVCKEWDDFSEFQKWALKNGYAEGLSIDRINQDGNYEPNNCRWVTQKEQLKNYSRNIFIEYQGNTRNLSEWSELLGINSTTLSYRLKHGWSTEKAFAVKRKRDCNETA
jgi:hypothetical protein